ncbi:dihydrolipoamide acetyltransferase family protein [Actinomadura sp. 7K507]|uniref:dihydrolipoamide acetyltransferase family protein n=1 Tax=Actinomadura sp. 7K507 TaxID=2530365 RepID=UPI0010526443|nr:dihydrolipoamide acetyltransferase family protein [Actinomadura sp. 7K507]TDC92527.1 2-oxo acid dehydrogenase subunit E2 [Actinomadura sp. 7K507]
MSEATVFRLPDLGEGLTEAEIIEWKVAVGDVVAVDQTVVEVETAKAAVEVPCPVAGTVTALYCEAGSVVDVGAPLLAVDGGQEQAPERERYREEERAGSGNVLVGYGTGTARRSRRAAARAARPSPAPVSEAPVSDVPAGEAPVGEAPVGEAPRVISPVVRRLAGDNGIDVGAITPSGPGGVVLRRDVETAIAAASRTAASRAPETSRPDEGDSVRVPLRGVRRTTADKLARSRREIPDASTWVDADATALVRLRKDIGRADPGARVGMLALFARICVAGLRRFPELNSYVDTQRQEIVQMPRVHLGFAAQTERGLVVPVVRDAQRMTLAELAAGLKERADEAREGRSAPGDLTGGTFTLNNYGVFGVDGSTPIINHPEAAMLGVGRIIERPWAFKGKVRLRKVTQLSLTFDHRVCDGGVAGGFLRFVADCVERPEVLVTHL